MVRIFLYLATNLSVILVLGIILSVTGIQKNSVYGLLITSTIFGFSGSLISLFISKWIALKSVDGYKIKFPKNATEKWLYQTILNQSKRVGINMPEIVVYHSDVINAFATGARKNSSLIAISDALLSNMNIYEIEAVIAHEMSHISNGDMVTMTLLQGIANTFIIFVSRILVRILSHFMSRRRNERENFYLWNSTAYTLISIFLEFTLGIFANIITMWFSRKREFYADSGSAKLVGYNNMIAALEKLKLSSVPKNHNAITALCINGSSQSLSSLLLTHPSLEERIKALKERKY